MSEPPPSVVSLAEHAAKNSLCMSRRGAVLYRASSDELNPAAMIFGIGYNGPPSGFACPGRGQCSRTCGQRSVHAEMRALRAGDPGSRADLVHVKIGPDDKLMPGKGPSCEQCSREIADVGFVGGVWLYEATSKDSLQVWQTWYLGARVRRPATPGSWHYYTAEDFHRLTLVNIGAGT